MREGIYRAMSRREGTEIGGEDRKRIHDDLAWRGGCCAEPDCWEPIAVGSVCAYHARPEWEREDDTCPK